MSIKQLFICEKPSQARDIARILNCTEKGEGFLGKKNIKVSWCFGHLLETAQPSVYCKTIQPWRMEILPIIPDDWQLIVKEGSKKQLLILKKLVQETDTVIIATDADREGELIAREILTLCKFNGEIKRLWLSALDDASIKKALENIREGHTTENLYYAGLGRQRADWLIGMNMTMASTILLNPQREGVLSVGRVQTPTLHLIVKRDVAIEQFKTKHYFELIAQFTTTENQSFYAKWQPPTSECDEDGYCLDKTMVESFAAKVRYKTATIEAFENAHKSQHPPICLSLSQLQKLASSQFNFSAQATLNLAQSLYETHKAITYPRTDCGYLPQSQFQDAPIILKNLKQIHETLSEWIDACDLQFQSPTWNDKKITAHHGMIPTLNPHVKLSNLDENERKLYELICRYYVAQFLGDYEYAQRKVSVRCQGELFKANSHTPLKAGWKRVLKHITGKDNSELDDHLSTLPLLASQAIVQHTDEKLVSKHTKPPSYFTEGTLIEAMKTVGKQLADEKLRKVLKETAGIGTESTRAAIIETLFKRHYLVKKGKHIVSTEKGRQLIAKLPPIVCDPLLTAEWEHALDQVAQGQLKLDYFLIQQKELVHTMLGNMVETATRK